MARLTVNGKALEVDVDPSTPLLWVIREQVGLTGTKYGCGVAQCGACTVHIDGAAVRSCVMPVAAAEGKQITTIEGLAAGGTLHKVQKAWLEHDVPQCGYLPGGHDHGGRRAAEGQAEADRRRHRRGDHQHLPLRHLPAGARGHPRRGEGIGRSGHDRQGSEDRSPLLPRRHRRRRRRARPRPAHPVRRAASSAPRTARPRSTPGS